MTPDALYAQLNGYLVGHATSMQPLARSLAAKPGMTLERALNALEAEAVRFRMNLLDLEMDQPENAIPPIGPDLTPEAGDFKSAVERNLRQMEARK